MQSLIELCLELACERRVAPADVESIEIELAPAAYQVSGDRGWADSLAAMQSARWVTAVVLADRDWWIEQSAPERIGDPEVGAFARERVSVTAVAEVPAAGVRLRVALADGSRVGLDSADAPGDPDRPLGRKQIEDKLRRAILHADVTASADELLELLHDLPTADSAVPLVRALGAPETA